MNYQNTMVIACMRKINNMVQSFKDFISESLKVGDYVRLKSNHNTKLYVHKKINKNHYALSDTKGNHHSIQHIHDLDKV